ncbi:MAG: hypothetical protein MI974_16920 [Chitinophagales bacterium]|nr:hypothetical protein [Chitinophagales bacterium]
MKYYCHYIATLLLFSLSNPLFAQYEKLTIHNGCHYDSTPKEKEYFIYEPMQSEEEILNEILDKIGLDHAEFQLRASNVGNAIATKENGIRYILYDPLFLSKVVRDADSKWAVYSIIAHEIGHHVYGHDFTETNPEKRKRMELQADDFSGRMINSLCGQEEDALCAINTLDPAKVSPNYPVLNARRAKIIDGWYTQKEIWERQGADPCGISIELKHGEKYKKNRASNARALITGDKMIIEFDSKHPNGSQRECRSFLITSPNLGLSPKNLEWRSDPTKFGDKQQLIWHYKKDNYTKEMVEKGDQLGIGVFEPRKVPYPLTFKDYIAPTLALAGGGISFYIGIDKKGIADDKYDLHRTNRSIGSPLYDEREQLFTDANDILDQSQNWKTAGYILTAIGTAFVIDRIIKAKRSKKGRLF